MRGRFTRRHHVSRWITCCMIGCCLLLAASCGGGGETASPRASGAAPPSSPKSDSVTTYHVSGKHILDNRGNVFIPYGVHLLGLFTLNWQQSQGYQHLDFEQIKSASAIWHANTVGIQLASPNLFVGDSYSQEYVAKVDQEVAWAHAKGMNTLLILQYEGIDGPRPPLPTEDSVRFWNFMSFHFRKLPWVFFDIFNEPIHPA